MEQLYAIYVWEEKEKILIVPPFYNTIPTIVVSISLLTLMAHVLELLVLLHGCVLSFLCVCVYSYCIASGLNFSPK